MQTQQVVLQGKKKKGCPSTAVNKQQENMTTVIGPWEKAEIRKYVLCK